MLKKKKNNEKIQQKIRAYQKNNLQIKHVATDSS